jgi:hypothetical protein
MLTMTVTQKAKRGGQPTFETAARAVMREVQEAFARLIEAVPVRPAISKAADLQKALGVDPKLGWRVFRVANAENPMAAGTEVPSRVSMQKLFKAALKQRVPESVVNRAATAFDEFETLVEEHAGDRDSFASMVSALTAEGSEQIDLNQRRAVYKGNSHIWGIQARSKIACAIIQPSEDDPNLFDAVFLRGVVGLCQLRRNRPFTISAIAMSDNDAITRRHPDIERLDLVDDQHGINLLHEFCTHPLPNVRNVEHSGVLVTQLLNTDVGSGAAFTGFLCDVYRKGSTRYRDEHNRAMRFKSMIESPFESTQVDALIRHGTFSDQPLVFTARTVARGCGENPDVANADVLFTDEPAAYLGMGADGLHTSDYPRYVEMINYVMERLGWDATEFEAYRYRVAYPVMGTVVVVECPLPEKPPTTPKPKAG